MEKEMSDAENFREYAWKCDTSQRIRMFDLVLLTIRDPTREDAHVYPYWYNTVTKIMFILKTGNM